MGRWILGAVIALGVAISAIAASYTVLGSLYGTAQREVYLRIENQLERVVPQTVGEAEQSNPYVLTYEDNENITGGQIVCGWSDIQWQQNIKLVSLENVVQYGNSVLNSPNANLEPLYRRGYTDLSQSDYLLTVPAPPSAPAPSEPLAETEEMAAAYGAENAAGTSFFVYETKPVNVLPIAASIGIAAGLVVFAAWIGYRQMWGDATSTLLEHGLHDMTVRDIEIVGHIMERGEFTIPELMKLTKASKITVWRTVQKLVEQGLVKPTDQTKQAANGLGGRGKPSQVYKYTSKGEPKP